MKTSIKLFLLSLISLGIWSCYGGNSVDVDPELREYVDRFNEEARTRGLNFEVRIEEIDIKLAEIFSSGVLGQCVSNEDRNDAIQIDQSYWKEPTTTDLDKEFVVFHELGHCVLNRGHINAADIDGICSSIMYNGNSTNCTLEYNAENREDLIDELFQ